MNTIIPFSLKDAPALIEHAWPTSKISEEVQKERKANMGQTLTALGSYWKGRKPLILTRGVLLASLMPATENREKDIEIFERLMAFDAQAMRRRLPAKKHDLLAKSYRDQVLAADRPEQFKEDYLLAGIWDDVNDHLGTNASSIVELVQQLGIMRFGRTPKVADTFSGSGSIPFEAARIGCNVYASDLNPVACMLTWASFNIVGASPEAHAEMVRVQEQVLKAIDEEIVSLGVEHDEKGNRAKVYLYCLETKCPRTGYMVPMAPSWVVSKLRNVIAKLIPDHQNKRYNIEIIEGVSSSEMEKAALGTIRGGKLYHPMLNDELGIAIKDIRGDYKDENGNNRNKLRLWEKSDFHPREDDIWQERLYCIQWMNGKDIAKGKKNPRIWFAAPTEADLQREEKVIQIVEENLADWQEAGFAPNMRIEHGAETTRLYRERGWTHWHHLFGPRHLLINVTATKHAKKHAFMIPSLGSLYNMSAKTCGWNGSMEQTAATYVNQAINTLYNYSSRAFNYLIRTMSFDKNITVICGSVSNQASREIEEDQDIILTDPPYADAVQYDEITEYFIAWLRNNPPEPFKQWIWDSRRAVAIKGSDHAFKIGMIEAYKAMTDRLSDNGLQIVQFTHQDNGVWADMAQIFWGAGLQVVQDWVVSTETTSELKKGGYVQGTHNIVCRKRVGNKTGYSTDLFGEIDDEVQNQIETMTGFNAELNSHNLPNIFSDDDLHTAGYAAALRVLTSYTHIDGEDMTTEALRPRRKGEKTIVDTLVEHAAKAAAKALVPQGIDKRHWQAFSNGERFYLKMIDLESTDQVRLELFQRYSTAYQVLDKETYMATNKANDASMKSANQFGRNLTDHPDFGRTSLVRIVLRAIDRIMRDHDIEEVISELKDLVQDYYRRHEILVAIAGYIAEKRRNRNEDEASAARVLRLALQNEKI
jgi:adenine-specific DNA methylase